MLKVTVNGTVKSGNRGVPNKTVNVIIANPSYLGDSQRYKTASATTDANGNFTAEIWLEAGIGEYSATVGTAVVRRHYFDLGMALAGIGDVQSQIENIYIYCYSVT